MLIAAEGHKCIHRREATQKDVFHANSIDWRRGRKGSDRSSHDGDRTTVTGWYRHPHLALTYYWNYITHSESENRSKVNDNMNR
jgi:hypothetical protein